MALVLFGVAGLVVKGSYAGPFSDLVHSYGGNVAVSFAAYFLAANVAMHSDQARLVAVGLSLAAVELFEVFDGFGVMSNVYDRVDLAANAAGIAVALALDTIIGPPGAGEGEPQGQSAGCS
ncbi:MAG: hypothetical protein ACE148_11495 [Vicinamibacterales bacterium]